MVDDTKLAIANAFKALIQEKSISKINVQDISSLALYHRPYSPPLN